MWCHIEGQCKPTIFYHYFALAAYRSVITSALQLSLRTQLTQNRKINLVLQHLLKVTRTRQYLKTHGPRHCTWGLVLLCSNPTSSTLSVVTPSGLLKTPWLCSMHGQNSTKVHFINVRSYQMPLSLCELMIPGTMEGGKRNYIGHCKPGFWGMGSLSGILVNGCMI